MKKIIIVISSAMLLSSCVTSTHLGDVKGLENLPRDSYTIMNEQESVSRANKFWLLFIPFGGKSDEKREAQCLNKMVKDNHADGVIAPKYVNKKITIPLIIFTYTYKWTTLTGKPYTVKTN